MIPGRGTKIPCARHGQKKRTGQGFPGSAVVKNLPARNRDTDVENKRMDTKGGKWWGRGGEMVVG